MPAGRPRGFDPDRALDQALEVFWQKGFEGTSLPDLTEAMGINRPSLYATFGNKEALFRRAVERYLARQSQSVQAALAEPTARSVVENLLRGAVTSLSNPYNPRGCLLVQGALACGADAEPVRRDLAAHRKAGEVALCERLVRAQTEGDFPAGANAADWARYVCTVLQGLSVQAATGADGSELRRIVECALRAWPT